jgi:hypothetical protein
MLNHSLSKNISDRFKRRIMAGLIRPPTPVADNEKALYAAGPRASTRRAVAAEIDRKNLPTIRLDIRYFGMDEQQGMNPRKASTPDLALL